MKPDKNFVRRFVGFNQLYKNELDKAKRLIGKTQEAKNNNNTKELSRFMREMDKHFRFIRIIRRNFEIIENKNLRKLIKWSKKMYGK